MDNPFQILENRIARMEEKLDLILERLEQPKIQSIENTLLNIDELSDYISLTKPTIYSKVSRRELPHIKRGKRLYFKKVEIDAWLDEGKQKTWKEIETEANAYITRKRWKGR